MSFQNICAEYLYQAKLSVLALWMVTARLLGVLVVLLYPRLRRDEY